ncbi:MAG: PorT family protein [Tannerella sp.]|jgi:hypothetical protein|nr:PorT family protein [Tannerella sp.]
MKMIKGLWPVIIVAMLLASSSAYAQFRFGVKAGANMSSVKFDKKLFRSDNFYGFHVGPMVEYMPKLGFGADAAILFAQKGFRADDKDVKINYIEVPLNVKGKWSLPVISPFAAAGPYVGFLVGDKDKDIEILENEIFKNEGIITSRNFVFGVNFSAGVEVFKKVQVSATYNWGLTKDYKTFSAKNPDTVVGTGKHRTWVVSAALLF